MIILYMLNIFLFSVSAEDITIVDTGIFDILEGDIAIIFYVTIQSMCEKDTSISVSASNCCDQTHSSEENTCDNMYLIGGYMGILKSKQTMNATLIHPNLYTSFRQGVCTIIVNYKTNNDEKVLTKDLHFRTNSSSDDNYSGQNQCETVDLDPLDSCKRVDCVIKYAGERSYFNPMTKECEHVPVCISDPKIEQYVGYSWINNQCINLKETCQAIDIEYLDDNKADVTDDVSAYQMNKICHHGDISSLNSECICLSGWRTTLSDDDPYEPSLLLYHMCNIETGTWNCVNKTKIHTTILIIVILVVTVASKVLLVMCILSWCYKHFKKGSKDIICTDEELFYDSERFLIECPLENCDKCVCTSLKDTVKCPSLRDQPAHLSYYPGKEYYSSITPETSRSRTLKEIKEKEFSIQIEHSTVSSTNEEGSTENEDEVKDANEKSADIPVAEKKSSKKVTLPDEETETTDYSIHLSNTSTSNVREDHNDSTETGDYALDFPKDEDEQNKQE